MTDKEEAYKLSKELIGNNDAIEALKVKMKGHKESIKAYDERNEVIMGELRVHTGCDELSVDAEGDNLTPGGGY